MRIIGNWINTHRLVHVPVGRSMGKLNTSNTVKSISLTRMRKRLSPTVIKKVTGIMVNVFV